MSGNLYFLIEGGEALAIVRDHIAQRIRTERRNAEICKELGVERYWPSVSNGTVGGVSFPGEPHRDFCKTNRRGASTPKRKTEWAKRFAEQVGYDRFGYDIAEALHVPTSISYTSENGHGGGGIGDPFQPCGFLYLSQDGPYALWTPDVPSVVARYEADGWTVSDPARSWKPEIDGARPILKEEWDLLVARAKLEEARQGTSPDPRTHTDGGEG